jgi:hypothetical protein
LQSGKRPVCCLYVGIFWRTATGATDAIMSLFVSVAAYRDPDLDATLRDCIAKAKYPNDLRFHVCWQHAEDEARPAVFDDSRVAVIDVPWADSLGACWARARIMQHWSGETNFLQIDSHHRFTRDWDARLFANAERSGAARPVLTTYGASFDPRDAEPAPGYATHIVFSHFMEDGIPMLELRGIPDAGRLTRPPRARFLSAHLLFAPGSFVRDVPYDPDLYFLGEEISLAIRAFTHGYDLFHPAEHILWHEQTRRFRRKHWDDHIVGQDVAMDWRARDALSRDKVTRFLRSPHQGPFGRGSVRGLGDYEAYTGIDFRRRVARTETRNGQEPPDPNHVRETGCAHVTMTVPRAALPDAALECPRFWHVSVRDAAGGEIYRHDASGMELRELVAGDSDDIIIGRAFITNRRPAGWTVWPVDRHGNWLSPFSGTMPLP